MQTKLDLAKIFGIDPNKITDKPATGISVDDGFRVAKRPTIDARFRHGQKSTSHTTDHPVFDLVGQQAKKTVLGFGRRATLTGHWDISGDGQPTFERNAIGNATLQLERAIKSGLQKYLGLH